MSGATRHRANGLSRVRDDREPGDHHHASEGIGLKHGEPDGRRTASQAAMHRGNLGNRAERIPIISCVITVSITMAREARRVVRRRCRTITRPGRAWTGTGSGQIWIGTNLDRHRRGTDFNATATERIPATVPSFHLHLARQVSCPGCSVSCVRVNLLRIDAASLARKGSRSGPKCAADGIPLR